MNENAIKKIDVSLNIGQVICANYTTVVVINYKEEEVPCLR